MSALSRYNDASNNQKSSFFSAVRGMVSMLSDHCPDVSSNAVVVHRLNPYLHVANRLQAGCAESSCTTPNDPQVVPGVQYRREYQQVS